jgi:hypothetical protein
MGQANVFGKGGWRSESRHFGKIQVRGRFVSAPSFLAGCSEMQQQTKFVVISGKLLTGDPLSCHLVPF